MARPEDISEFRERLIASAVLTGQQIDDAVWKYNLQDLTEPEELAAALVKKDLMTAFQAEHLLEGGQRGLLIDGYRIVDVLGAGGMGRVYVAEEGESGWQVALKVLADKFRNDNATKSRFQLEAQAGMKLNHANIVRTRGIYKTEDIYGEIHYVVMDLIRGISLMEMVVLQGNVPWQQACDIIMQAAEGLQNAHDMGMIHRDVKPENVLVRSNGQVKILDFGLAMLDQNDEEFVMAMIHGQDCLGTADYVAPEQTFDSYKVDARADVYGLGCTFYSALTGKLPFPVKSSKEKILCHRKKRPRPIREIRPEVPERVELIVRKMMAKRPDNRFASAAEVARYLKPYAKRQDVTFDFPVILKWRSKKARQSMSRVGTTETMAASESEKRMYRDEGQITGQETQMEIEHKKRLSD